jgi:DNA-binding transcriptional LysR family regulator
MSAKKIPLDQLSWDNLRIYLAIARAGSLSEAAKHLRLDHSTLSRRLGQLELSLGGAVFERSRKGLKRTELGERILASAEQMESGAVALREAMDSGSQIPSGKVRVAMMEGIGSLYLARRLKPLLDAQPLIKVELVTSAQLVNISRREADLFLSFFKPQGRGLHIEPAGKFRLALYGAERYFKQFGKPRSRADLSSHRFVSYIDDLIQVDTVRWLDEVITNPQLALLSNSMIAQMAAAASGVGLVLLPCFAVQKEDELESVLANEIQVERELFLSVHHDLQYSVRVRTVMDYLRTLLLNDRLCLNAPL